MNRVEQAVDRFEKGFNCSQAVLGSYCEQFGLNYEQASKLACGFGGGMHIGGECGAVTGAIMVLGLKYGNSTSQDSQSKSKTYEKTVEFANRFRAQNGSIGCKELLGCDICTDEGMKKARELGLFESICPKMVKRAAEILEQMFAEE